MDTTARVTTSLGVTSLLAKICSLPTSLHPLPHLHLFWSLLVLSFSYLFSGSTTGVQNAASGSGAALETAVVPRPRDLSADRGRLTARTWFIEYLDPRGRGRVFAG